MNRDLLYTLCTYMCRPAILRVLRIAALNVVSDEKEIEYIIKNRKMRKLHKKLIEIYPNKYIYEEIRILYYDNNGKRKTWYLSGMNKYELDYKNDKMHGKYIEWYESGNKYSETDYKDGKMHGKNIHWYESGMKYYEINCKDGKIHGKNVRWSQSGNKYYEMNYKDGKIHGKSICWYLSGIKQYVTDYIINLYELLFT